VSADRFARWLAGWRVALRIAQRDARRYKWRSALIVVMVGLPVLLLTGGITLLATKNVSTAESVPRVMGAAQAQVFDNGAGRMVQSPDGQSSASAGKGGDAVAVPGFSPDSRWTANKIQKVTGGRVIQTVDAYLRVTQGDRRPNIPVLGIDARDPLARGMTDLVSGRWARSKSEVVVTEAGIANGLPGRGTLTTAGSQSGKPEVWTVVGVATGQTENQMPFLVGLPETVMSATGPVEAPAVAFLVERNSAVTWSDVRRMNSYGLLVKSRAVFLNPPSLAELDPQVAETIGSGQSDNDLVLLIAAVGLFIETTLLAGPAFAVSAARQRRSLALAASNGAEARQLRRYVLGQAVVLGVVSAAFAVVAGLLLTIAALTWWRAGHADFSSGPLEVSWPRVVGVFTCAVVASVVAALLPAKGMARLDIVSVLAGRAGDRKVRRGIPVAGVVAMVLSAFAIFWSVISGGEGGIGPREYLIVGGAIGLVLGCVMTIPALLALLGRRGSRLPLPLRLATRDTARQRGRSTPAVAAIMAAVGALTALSIGAASDTRQRQQDYQAQLPMGQGRVYVTQGDDKVVRSIFRTYAPDLALSPVGAVGDPVETPGSMADLVAAKPPRCSDAAVFGGFGDSSGRPVDPHCVRLGAGVQGQRGQIEVLPLKTLTATVPVSPAQARILQRGGMLVVDPGLPQGGYADFVTGRVRIGKVDGPHAMPTVTGHLRVPAAAIDQLAWHALLADKSVGAWVLPETATRLGWPVTPNHLEVISPAGMIPVGTETALKEHLDDQNMIQVERGFQNDSRATLLILFSVAGLLVLVASLISTALSLAESQNDMATLAAVGATRGTRRGFAASQAFVVAGCGCLLGVGVGMIPGIAMTWPLTVVRTASAGQTGPIIEIPWLPLVTLVVLVPFLAAALAWVAIRRHPQMTRRLT
jgi:putative ABC transport system permease protein